MKAFWAMTLAELKINLRNTLFIIFTLIMPLLLIFLFGGLYGNDPSSKFDGYGAISASIPAYLTLVLSIIALTGLPMQMVGYKENKVLKRLKSTPISKGVIFAPIFITYLILFFIAMALLMATGVIFYGVRLEGNFFAFCFALILSMSAIFSMGFLLSCLCSNVKQVAAIGFALLIPMIFLSGATMPLSAFPDVMNNISKVVPITYSVEFLQNTFLGKPFSDNIVSIIVLLAITIVCTILSIKLFKWE